MWVSRFWVKTVMSYSRLNRDFLKMLQEVIYSVFLSLLAGLQANPWKKMSVATVTTVSRRVFPQPLYAAVKHSFSRFAGRTYIVTFKYTTHQPPWAPGSISGCPTLHSPGVWQAHIVEDWQPLLSAGLELSTAPWPGPASTRLFLHSSWTENIGKRCNHPHVASNSIIECF